MITVNMHQHKQLVGNVQACSWHRRVSVEFLPYGRQATLVGQVQLQPCTVPTSYSNSQLGCTLFNPGIGIMSTTTCTYLLGHVPTLLWVPRGHVHSVLAALQPVQTVLIPVHYTFPSTVTHTP